MEGVVLRFQNAHLCSIYGMLLRYPELCQRGAGIAGEKRKKQIKHEEDLVETRQEEHTLLQQRSDLHTD